METIPKKSSDVTFIKEIASFTFFEVISYYERLSEKELQIAKKHLLKKQLSKNGLRTNEFKINNVAINNVIKYYTREAGVRNLEKEISKV